MIAEFDDRLQKNAHALFQAWRRSNPEGFFLNRKTSKLYLLHHVECEHVGDMVWEPTDYSKSLTKTPKICSTNDEELLAWAQEHGAAVRDCNDCVESI